MSQPSGFLSVLVALLDWLGISFVHSHRPRHAYITLLYPFRILNKKGWRHVQLPLGDKVPLQLNVFDAAGDPITSLTPAPVWTSSDPTVATIDPSTDGFSAVCTSVKAGSVVVTCQVTPNVSATLAVDVVPGVPASATITAGAPVPISGS